jgi:hypothetical protein
MKKEDEIFLGGGTNLNIQTSKNVELRETLILINGQKEPIELDVKIIADFDTIPETYHEVFLNIMTSKYYNKVSYGDNPFSQCLPPKKKKWYQFWK